jgi:hypothetical protein
MNATALAPTCDFTADWHVPTRRVPDGRLVPFVRSVLTEEQLEIFEMQAEEHAARCVLSECFGRDPT